MKKVSCSQTRSKMKSVRADLAKEIEHQLAPDTLKIKAQALKKRYAFQDLTNTENSTLKSDSLEHKAHRHFYKNSRFEEELMDRVRPNAERGEMDRNNVLIEQASSIISSLKEYMEAKERYDHVM
jgi:hypothetical protein